MAKDGTNRGGARIGAGAKKKPLAERIAEGNPGKRELTVIDFTDSTVDLEGQPMPNHPRCYLLSKRTAKSSLLQMSTRKHGTGCMNVAALLSSLRSFWSATP